MRLVVGLRPVSDTLGKPDLGGRSWAGLVAGQAGLLVGLGLRLVSATRLRSPGCGELCLGGLLDGQGLFHTHLLGLRLVLGWQTLRPVSDYAA